MTRDRVMETSLIAKVRPSIGISGTIPACHIPWYQEGGGGYRVGEEAPWRWKKESNRRTGRSMVPDSLAASKWSDTNSWVTNSQRERAPKAMMGLGAMTESGSQAQRSAICF